MNNELVMVSSIPTYKEKLRELAASSIQGKRETSPGPESKNVHQVNIDIPGSLVTLGSVYGSVNAAVDWFPGVSKLQANADFMAACDPETITGLLDEIEHLRANLAERDSLLRRWLDETHPPEDTNDLELAPDTKAALYASAEPIAPTELDERSAFESIYPVPSHVKWDCDNNEYADDRYADEGGGSYQPLWEGWQARAAMERKK